MADEEIVFGLEENIAGALAYLGGFITGLVFFLMEKKNKFVRFHAVQSIILSGGLMILSMILSRIPLLGLFAGLLTPIVWILMLFLLYKAYKGEKYKLPMVGEYAEKYSKPK